MKIAVVTCTGKRPLMMPLCARWIAQQTRQPDLWIVSLGRGEQLGNTHFPDCAKIHFWDPETIGKDLHGQIDTNSKYQIEAIRQVPKDYAAVYFDDDDWYGKDYIATVEREFAAGYQITGNGIEHRYSLTMHRWMSMHKSGCNAGAVAMMHEAIPSWIEWLQDPYTKWDWLKSRFAVNLRNEAPRVAIKHGPGLGHLFPPHERKWRIQGREWEMLERWIGADVEHYKALCAQLT